MLKPFSLPTLSDDLIQKLQHVKMSRCLDKLSAAALHESYNDVLCFCPLFIFEGIGFQVLGKAKLTLCGLPLHEAPVAEVNALVDLVPLPEKCLPRFSELQLVAGQKITFWL